MRNTANPNTAFDGKGINKKDNTWKPTAHLPKSHILSHIKPKKLEILIPSNIDD